MLTSIKSSWFSRIRVDSIDWDWHVVVYSYRVWMRPKCFSNSTDIDSISYHVFTRHSVVLDESYRNVKNNLTCNIMDQNHTIHIHLYETRNSAWRRRTRTTTKGNRIWVVKMTTRHEYRVVNVWIHHALLVMQWFVCDFNLIYFFNEIKFTSEP
jgi:hypothetical protein